MMTGQLQRVDQCVSMFTEKKTATTTKILL